MRDWQCKGVKVELDCGVVDCGDALESRAEKTMVSMYLIGGQLSYSYIKYLPHTSGDHGDDYQYSYLFY